MQTPALICQSVGIVLLIPVIFVSWFLFLYCATNRFKLVPNRRSLREDVVNCATVKLKKRPVVNTMKYIFCHFLSSDVYITPISKENAEAPTSVRFRLALSWTPT